MYFYDLEITRSKILKGMLLGKVSSLLFLGLSRIKFLVLFGSANGVNGD